MSVWVNSTSELSHGHCTVSYNIILELLSKYPVCEFKPDNVNTIVISAIGYATGWLQT